ncbi:MAG: hypothetical protein JO372_05585 [Solirubrobacterales bacterium]|nr:hypothetical protein [Solirubrobacterales bacterium]
MWYRLNSASIAKLLLYAMSCGLYAMSSGPPTVIQKSFVRLLIAGSVSRPRCFWTI